MFSTKQQLEKKTGPDGIGRYDFLKQLVNEFYKTQSREAKRQVLANLANFAYDPINYESIRQLHIIDVFLEQLSQTDEDLLNFALGGICNLINDLENQSYILNLNGIYLISQYVNHNNSEIATNSLGTLNLILSPENFHLFAHLLPSIEELQNHTNPRVKNLAIIFATDFTRHVCCSAKPSESTEGFDGSDVSSYNHRR